MKASARPRSSSNLFPPRGDTEGPSVSFAQRPSATIPLLEVSFEAQKKKKEKEEAHRKLKEKEHQEFQQQVGDADVLFMSLFYVFFWGGHVERGGTIGRKEERPTIR